MHAVADIDQSHRGVERGFTIIELIVAGLLLMMALGGAVVMATSSSRATTTSAVRQTQTAILSSAAEKVRSDSSWTSDQPLTCGSVGQRADISAWINARIVRELAPDELRGSSFEVTATALAVDSSADQLCPDDADGIVPDYYDIEVVSTPDADTSSRTPGAAPLTQRFQVDFSSRTSGGRLSIQACYVWPQRDERTPTGSCDDDPDGTALVLPPAQVPLRGDTELSAANLMCSGSQGADCDAWKCAHPLLHGACESGEFGNSVFVSVRPIAASGWRYSVRGVDPNTSGEPVRTGQLLADGTATVDAMVPGRYEVRITPAADVVPWTTHSVPASGVATVERGIRSRIVQMFRPARRQDPLRIPAETRDVTEPPWATGGAYPVVPQFKWGDTTYSLVPAPLGRATDAAKAVIRYNDGFIEFTDVEPGLYATRLRTGTTSYKRISNSMGFFFVPPGDADPIMLPAQDWKLKYDTCDADRRERLWGIAVTHTNPDPLGSPSTWTSHSCRWSGGGGTGPPPPTPPGGGNS